MAETTENRTAQRKSGRRSPSANRTGRNSPRCTCRWCRPRACPPPGVPRSPGHRSTTRPGPARLPVRVRPGPRCRPGSSLAIPSRRTTTAAAVLVGSPVRLQIDQDAGNAGLLQLFQRLARQLCRQFDQREVRLDRDVAEIAAVQTTFVGDGADDRARSDLVPLPDRDAIGGETLFGSLTRTTRALGRTVLVLLAPALRRRLG